MACPNHKEAARLAALRAVAQSHLEEISAQQQREAAQEQVVAAALQEEVERRASRGRNHHHRYGEQGEVVAGEKLGKLRSAQDVLNRITHDPSLDAAEYTVGYLDRFGGIVEVDVSEWVARRGDGVEGEEWVPMHRVRWVKRQRKTGSGGEGSDEDDGERRDGLRDEREQKELVWDRVRRVDLVFGRGRPLETSQCALSV